jgi:beta-lactamase regulating signal transducer with metallopeptidase domain
MNDPIYPVNVVLQAVLLAGAAWVSVACLRGCERRARAGLLAVVVCGVMPFLTALVPVRESRPISRVVRIQPLPVAEVTEPAVVAEEVPVVADLPQAVTVPKPKLRWTPWVLWIWLAGSTLGTLHIAREVIRGRRWQRAFVIPSDPEWESIRSHLPTDWDRESVRISDDPAGPCAIGFWKPRIVIPRWLLEPHRHRELGWALRHEAEHLRCHDTRWIYLVRVIRAVQWWNPFLHRLVGVWAQSREQACDLHATRHPAERPDYGHFLLQIAGGERARLATWMAAKGELKRLRRRINSLMDARARKAAPAGPGWTLAMTAFMVATGLVSSMVGFADPDAGKAADGSPAGDLSWLEPAPQVSIQTAILITPAPFAKQGAMFTDAEAQAELARWVGRTGVYFQSLSGDTAPAGTPQSVQLTVSRDNLASESPWDGTKIVSQFVGWVIHYQPTVSGAEVRLGVKAAYAFPPGNHPAPGFALDLGQRNGTPLKSPVLPVGMPWGNAVLATADEIVTIPDGKILCTTLGEVEKGVCVQCLTGVRLSKPWQGNCEEFAALQPLPGEPGAARKVQVQTQMRKDAIEPSPVEKALSLDVTELEKRLKTAIDTYPANWELRAIRTGLQAKLDGALLDRNGNLSNELRWKILAVTQRMTERAIHDPEIAALDGERDLKMQKLREESQANLKEYYRTHPVEFPKPSSQDDERRRERLKKFKEDFHRTNPGEFPKLPAPPDERENERLKRLQEYLQSQPPKPPKTSNS